MNPAPSNPEGSSEVKKPRISHCLRCKNHNEPERISILKKHHKRDICKHKFCTCPLCKRLKKQQKNGKNMMATYREIRKENDTKNGVPREEKSRELKQKNALKELLIDIKSIIASYENPCDIALLVKFDNELEMHIHELDQKNTSITTYQVVASYVLLPCQPDLNQTNMNFQSSNQENSGELSTHESMKEMDENEEPLISNSSAASPENASTLNQAAQNDDTIQDIQIEISVLQVSTISNQNYTANNLMPPGVNQNITHDERIMNDILGGVSYDNFNNQHMLSPIDNPTSNDVYQQLYNSTTLQCTMQHVSFVSNSFSSFR